MAEPRPLTLCERLLADLAASETRAEVLAPPGLPPGSNGPTAALYAQLRDS